VVPRTSETIFDPCGDRRDRCEDGGGFEYRADLTVPLVQVVDEVIGVVDGVPAGGFGVHDDVDYVWPWLKVRWPEDESHEVGGP
jgi:hypothetical protein